MHNPQNRIRLECAILCLASLCLLPHQVLGQTAPELVTSGNQKFISGNMDGAIADYNRAIELDPKNADASFDRGSAKLHKGDLEGALADLNRAIELNPKLAEAWTNRGSIKKARGDSDGAIADYDRAIDLNPTLSEAFNNRGNAKQMKGDLDGATADYTRAIELNAKYALPLNNRGNVKNEKGDLDGAIADYTQAIKLDPKYAHAFFSRGIAYMSKGDLDTATTDLLRCCQLSPQDQDYSQFYLWVIRARRHEDARKALAAYMDKRPAEAAPDWPAAIASFLLDKLDEKKFLIASESTVNSIDRGNHCEAWYFIAEKHLAAGDKAGAIVCFKKCVATGQTKFSEFGLAQTALKTAPE